VGYLLRFSPFSFECMFTVSGGVGHSQCTSCCVWRPSGADCVVLLLLCCVWLV
jgi:hypothetical protein